MFGRGFQIQTIADDKPSKHQSENIGVCCVSHAAMLEQPRQRLSTKGGSIAWRRGERGRKGQQGVPLRVSACNRHVSRQMPTSSFSSRVLFPMDGKRKLPYAFDFGVLGGALLQSRQCMSRGTDSDLWPQSYSFMEVEIWVLRIFDSTHKPPLEATASPCWSGH